MRHTQTTLENIYGTADTITALAGGGKAGSPLIQKTLSRVSVCATNADSVQLDFPALPACECVIANDGAASLTIYAQGTDTIDGVANGTGKALATTKRIHLFCVTAGAWLSFVGA